jgi:hypothetical protein
MAKPVVHAQGYGGNDLTLCGDAYEGACTGDPEEDEEPVLAASGDTVTCETCRAVIAYCKDFKRNRQP